MQEKEKRKTLTYLFVAGIAVLVAWEPWQPAPPDDSVPAEVGTRLFPDFKDPLSAKSLEVMRFDEDTATLRPFKVAQINGVWAIPSHSNYPADAREHMAQAATSLLDLEVLGVDSNNPGDQELYGVITPDPEKLRQGMTGVGTRVTIRDGKDNVLADLVIGKEVKDQPALRYVRRADRDQICRVAIKTDKLSTKFEDWIEKDLLKLNAFDVRQVELNDYSTLIGRGASVALDQRSRIKVGFDDTKSNWNLIEMDEFDEKHNPVPQKLAEDEELNSEKLNNLKTALDDLQIVDVDRKPAGLSQDLKASDEFVKNSEALNSLATRGFYPVSGRSGAALEILSSEGEATCTTKDGVRYVLRFGQLAGGEEPKTDDKAGDKKTNPALNRYLFVMAQFDESQIPKPQLESIGGEEKPAENKAGEATPGDAKPEEPSAEDAKPSDATPAAESAKPAAPKAPANKKAADAKVPQKKTSADEGAPDPSAAKADDKPAAADATEPHAQDAKPEDAKDAKKVEPPATPEEEYRVAIEKENKRKQDEYDASIKKGQDRV